MKCRKWEVWFAKVKYEDSDVVKKRPVLIIGERVGIILSLKMTSHTARDHTDYPLNHWARAGLERETVVRTAKACYLKDSDLVWRMGRISEHDMLQIQSILLQQ
jgi:hypothetical protein